MLITPKLGKEKVESITSTEMERNVLYRYVADPAIYLIRVKTKVGPVLKNGTADDQWVIFDSRSYTSGESLGMISLGILEIADSERKVSVAPEGTTLSIKF